jgi:hypothetical protein
MNILIVTGMEGAENCAKTLTNLLGMECEAAQGRKTAIGALKRSEYRAIVVDEGIVAVDSAGADLIWEHAGLAIPLELNCVLSGARRLARGHRQRTQGDGGRPFAALPTGVGRSRDIATAGRKTAGRR